MDPKLWLLIRLSGLKIALLAFLPFCISVFLSFCLSIFLSFQSLSFWSVWCSDIWFYSIKINTLWVLKVGEIYQHNQYTIFQNNKYSCQWQGFVSTQYLATLQVMKNFRSNRVDFFLYWINTEIFTQNPRKLARSLPDIKKIRKRLHVLKWWEQKLDITLFTHC